MNAAPLAFSREQIAQFLSSLMAAVPATVTMSTQRSGAANAGRPSPVRHPLICSDRAIRRATPGRRHLGQNLFLVVRRNGTRYFMFRSRVHGVDRVTKMGEYPAMSLAQAQVMVHAEQEARLRGTTVIPPQALGRPRRLMPAVIRTMAGLPEDGTFGDWCDKHLASLSTKAEWVAGTRDKIGRMVARYLKTSVLWETTITAISLPEIVALIDSIEDGSHAHMAKAGSGSAWNTRRLRSLIGDVFRYAMSKGVQGLTDPVPLLTLGSNRRHAKSSVKMPSVVGMADAGALMNRILASPEIPPTVKRALWLQGFTVHRSEPICQAEWSEFQLDGPNPTWSVPRHKMKMKDANRGVFIMPLDAELAAEIKSWPRLHERWVFPNAKGTGPLGRDALPSVYRDVLDLKDKHVPHGWRSVFSTHGKRTGDDGLPVHDHVGVEFGLDHEPRTAQEQSYDRKSELDRAAAMRAPLNDYRAALRRAMAEAKGTPAPPPAVLSR